MAPARRRWSISSAACCSPTAGRSSLPAGTSLVNHHMNASKSASRGAFRSSTCSTSSVVPTTLLSRFSRARARPRNWLRWPPAIGPCGTKHTTCSCALGLTARRHCPQARSPTASVNCSTSPSPTHCGRSFCSSTSRPVACRRGRKRRSWTSCSAIRSASSSCTRARFSRMERPMRFAAMTRLRPRSLEATPPVSLCREAPAMLEVDRIETYRGPVQVLRDVSLRVGAGESVVLVGRNGAGKTTTIETIMGLLPAQAGAVTFKGAAITRMPTYQRALLGIGYAPEDAGIFPDLSVAENFHICQWLARPAGKSDRRAGSVDVEERIFGVFPEVKAFMDRRGLHLSGGQKKMVAVARAMALSPSVLLLDEPFEGLAPVVVTRLTDEVNRIKAMGVALLIAESNLMTAIRIADRLYAIDRGEIIFQGTPADAVENEDVMRTLRG